MPAWETVLPRDPEAIQTLIDAFVNNKYDIRSVLRVLFNSEFFKNSQFARVKSPAELIAGTVRLAGGHRIPEHAAEELGPESVDMGQALLDPPSVEGWHTGKEWITTANLARRADFAVRQFAEVDSPGVKSIVNRIQARGSYTSPEQLVEACLDFMGPLIVSDGTLGELSAHARTADEAQFDPIGESPPSAQRISEILRLIVSTPDYQMA